MTQNPSLQAALQYVSQRALLVGVGGVVLALLGFWLAPTHFFRAYLLGYLFWIGVSLGCLALLMLQYLTGGAWGAVVRRLLEAGTCTLPLMAVLFVPLLFGLEDLYLWARPEVVAQDALLQHKSPYLNVSFFWQRAVGYFVIWLLVTYLLNRWSRQQEQENANDRVLRRRLQLLSAPGLVLYVLTITFASIDWVMSLEPHWYSTIYGIIILMGQVLISLAFAIVLLARLADFEPFAGVVAPGHFHDLGNLLLAFVMLWAYIAFSQFLIIWSGNLAEEVSWYIHRTRGGWQWIGILLVGLHFIVPFFILLSRATKRSPRLLAAVAMGIIVMHLLDLFWLVMPAFYPTGLSIHWLDIVLPVGMGGIWLVVFVWNLRRRSFLPLHDRSLQGAAHHG